MLSKNILENKKAVKDGMMEFHKGGIESKLVVSFIPFGSIGRIWLGEIQQPIWLLIVGILFCIFFITSIPFGGIAVFVGLCFGVLGVFLIYRYVNGIVYALNIETSSGTMFSFMASDRKYVTISYSLLLEELNKRDTDRRTGTYNFINGKFNGVAIGDKAKVQGA